MNPVNRLIARTLFILILSLSNVVTASANATLSELQIGLFNLLKPTRIDIEVIGAQSVSIKKGDTESNGIEQLKPGQLLRLSLKESLIEYRLIDQMAGDALLTEQQIRRWQINQLEISGSGSIKITIPDKLVRQIPASVKFIAQSEIIRTIINTPIEQAIKIITASELTEVADLNANQRDEIYRAMAVVVRSYLYRYQGRHRSDGYDLCDNTHCMLYYGEDIFTRSQQSATIKQSVYDTERLILTHQGQVIAGYFTAACGGSTALPSDVWPGEMSPADRDAFRAVTCRYCQNDRFYRWERTVDQTLLWQALSGWLKFRPGEDAELRVAQQNPRGFINKLEIVDRGRRIPIDGAKFRHIVGLKLGWNLVLSNAYSIKPRGGQLVFTGRGFGHNLGLCVAGAVEQARQGQSYQEILHYYFPAAQIVKR